MRNKFLLSLLCIGVVCIFDLSAQIAGEIPTGGSRTFPNIDLRLTQNYSDTITFLDIDLDGDNDLNIRLYKGYPPHDASNMVFLEVIDSKFSICVDSVNAHNAVHYSLNDSLCNGVSSWGAESLMIGGCYGGWSCTHDTSSVSNKFFAYKDNFTGEVGWIKFDMKLYAETDSTHISFSISELLTYNLGTSVSSPGSDFHFVMSPNPLVNDNVTISSSNSLRMVEIYDIAGKQTARYLSDFDNMYIPGSPGVYIIKVYDNAGHATSGKLLKL